MGTVGNNRLDAHNLLTYSRGMAPDQPSYCTSCGNPLLPGGPFCTGCGTNQVTEQRALAASSPGGKVGVAAGMLALGGIAGWSLGWLAFWLFIFVTAIVIAWDDEGGSVALLGFILGGISLGVLSVAIYGARSLTAKRASGYWFFLGIGVAVGVVCCAWFLYALIQAGESY